MKTIQKTVSKCRSRTFWLSLLCAGVVATFLGGCAEGPYVSTYDTGSYYPTASYYTPYSYDYYYPDTYYYGYGPVTRRTYVGVGPGYYSTSWY